MSRDIDELNNMSDFDDADDNFEPADYNTQDMRNINEKVNRILYGKTENEVSKKDENQIDINKKVSEQKQEKTNTENKVTEKTVEDNKSEELVDITKVSDVETFDTEEKQQTPKKKKILVGSVIGVVVVICVVLAFSVLGLVSPQSNNESKTEVTETTTEPVVITNEKGEFVFAKGCTVSDVDISGLTVVQARILLKNQEKNSRPEMNITVNVDGEETKFTEDDFTFKYDTSSVLEEEKTFSKELAEGKAYAAVRDNDGNLYYKEQVKEITASLNQSSVDKIVKKIYKKYNVEATDAHVTEFNPDASKMFTYEEGKSGLEVDMDDLQSQMNTIIEQGNVSGDYTGTITLNRVETQPKVDVAYLKENLVQLASWETISGSDSNGNENMNVSLKACNGSIIEPGETWSFNECTGDSNDPNLGYKSGGVIVDGSYTTGIGGGICQSSTTIFNAAVRSNLTIVERNNHTYPSSYAYSGFDAAIDYGNLDLKLKNDSEYQIFLGCYMDGITLHATFYGIKDNSYETIDTYSENYNITSSSYNSRSYRIYRDKKGKEISREELPVSYYSLGNGATVRVADSGGSKYEYGEHVG